MEKNKTLGIAVLIILIVGGSYYYFSKKQEGGDNELPKENVFEIPSASTTTTIGGVGYTGTATGTIEVLPITSTGYPTPPQYRRSFTYPLYFTAEARVITDKTFAELYAKLDVNKYDLIAWIELGNQYNLVKDLQGARIAWEYATKLNPDHFMAYANLGGLYMSDLRDYVKSEQNFRLAISADPKQVSVYRELYDLYRYGLKNDAKAKAVLQEGIDNNPGKAQDLIYLRDHYNES